MESVVPSDLDQEALALLSDRKDRDEVLMLTELSMGNIKFILQNYPLGVKYNVVGPNLHVISHP